MTTLSSLEVVPAGGVDGSPWALGMLKNVWKHNEVALSNTSGWGMVAAL